MMSPEQASLERYRVALDPLRRLAMIGLPLIIGLLAGVSATSEWKDWLLFRNGTSFGTSDPQFNVDVGFYVFTLPFLRFIIGFLFAAVVLAFIVAVVVHYVYGGIRLQPADDRLSSRAAQAHLTATLVGLLRAAQGGRPLPRPLRRCTSRPTNFVPGVNLQGRQRACCRGLTILMWISLICAVLFFLSAFSARVSPSRSPPCAARGLGPRSSVRSTPRSSSPVQVRPDRAGQGVAVHPEQHRRDEGLTPGLDNAEVDAVHRGQRWIATRRRHQRRAPARSPTSAARTQQDRGARRTSKPQAIRPRTTGSRTSLDIDRYPVRRQD